MSYPDTERRRPREFFHRQLERICNKLDACSTSSFDFARFDHTTGTQDVEVLELWVVGSFARGALTCGDLDLVAKVTDYGWVPYKAVTNTFFSRPADVRIYLGTPDENASGVSFPEARRIWAKGADWKSALGDITPDPSAARMPRPYDAIPLRLEQIPLDFSLYDELLQAELRQDLAFSFIPLSSIALDADSMAKAAHSLTDISATKQEILPYVLGYLALMAPSASPKFDYRCHTCKAGGTLVAMTPSEFDIRALDNPTTTRVAFMPKLSTRGPNGIWVIERGKNHPLVQGFKNTNFWVLKDNNKISSFQCTDISLGYPLECTGIDIFKSEADALQFIQDVGYDTENLHSPVCVTGTQLLLAMGGTDMLLPADGSEPITYTYKGFQVSQAWGYETKASPCDENHSRFFEALLKMQGA